jgi:hypothetical protein
VTLDVLHRIRWANVARAIAVALALLLALAWPRLRDHPDALAPAVEPAPVAPVKPAAAANAPRATVPARVNEAKPPHRDSGVRRARATAVPKRPAAKRRVRKRHRHARHRGPRSPRIDVPARTPVPAYVVAPAVPAQAAEFRP